MKSEKKSRKNPLNRRIGREIKGDFRKYLVIFLFLSMTIGFVSGMFVADDSMLSAAEDSVSEYHREDGKFTLKKKADGSLIQDIEAGDQGDVRAYVQDKAEKEAVKAVEKDGRRQIEDAARKKIREQIAAAGLTGDMAEAAEAEAMKDASGDMDEALADARKKAVKEARKKAGEVYDEKVSGTDAEKDFSVTPVTLYENFSKDAEEDIDLDGSREATVRVYMNRTEVDTPCVMAGKLPEKEGEVVLDRMHARNHKISIGDTIDVGGKHLTVTGFVALPDYTSLYEKSTDMMFDALTFDVALVTPETFDEISGKTNWTYSWLYKTTPENDRQADTFSGSFSRVIATNAEIHDNSLTDYIPAYSNQAIVFATDDMGSDKSMGVVLLMVLTVVIAFIFAITISSTITKEAAVIGTLRASGYTRGELVRHYLAMPLIVTLAAAVVGNVLGYTAFKETIVSMYYDSYSLPTYITRWNPEAFLMTTVPPFVIMLAVNLIVISRRLSIPPIRFLRNDLGRRKRKKAVRLPRISFLRRFRLRILLQNIPNYLVLCFGIFFAEVLMTFALAFPSTLRVYQDKVTDQIFAKYQYMLYSSEDEDGKTVTTKNPDAEKIGMTSLVTTDGPRVGEEITIYGIAPDSRYVKTDLQNLKEGEGIVSRAYADKFGLKTGDRVHLKEKYQDDAYDFTVRGISDYPGGLALFMPLKNYNQVFDLDQDSFSGFFSDTEITDIDPDLIATTITPADVVKVAKQLDHSMGSYMQVMQVVCVILAAGLIYLLSKVIIEKNANAVSMTKILGYTSREIAALYIIPTMWVVIISGALFAFLSDFLVKVMFELYMEMLDGWIPYALPVTEMVKGYLFILTGYAVVTAFDYRRVKRIPMDQALKHVE